jgi:Rrf2 family protein
MKSFLNVPKKVQYGLMLVSHLANHEQAGGQPVSLDVVADVLKVSQGFLEEIAGDLRRAGLIVGRRGRVGGYVLAKEANGITVYDIVVATHGPVTMAECATVRKDFSVWGVVQDRMVETLTSVTVAEFARHMPLYGRK